MEEIKLLLSNSVHRIVGYVRDKRKKKVEAEIILFKDGESYIELNTQGMEYHDCNLDAKEMIAYKSKDAWGIYNTSEDYKDANTLDYLYH